MTTESTLPDIRIGIIGIGAMGKGLIYQSQITPQVATLAICDIETERCTNALEEFGIGFQIVTTQGEMTQALNTGLVAVCTDGELLSCCDGLDVIIEATGTIIPAANFCESTLTHKKHLVLMNSEIDLILGPYLKDLAERNQVVCTSCDGDQYGVMKHLLSDITQWGFEPVMAGNIKGFLNRYATPEMMVHEAEIRNLDVRACTSYTDGTKLNIEMALIANEMGMQPTCPGMQGPACTHVDEVLDLFDLASDWQPGKPLVDYILGADPGGGVYAVGYCDAPYQQDMLRYYKMGDGPFYLFYRHYHLCHIEAMKSVIEAQRENKSLMLANAGFKTNVFTYAKHDLSAGELLDGIGGYHCYGLIENQAGQEAAEGLPICLAEQVLLKRDIKKDQRILLSDIDFDPDRIDFRLYREACRLGQVVSS